ncbi:MAG TPA: hypothetical protein VEO18_08025 [Thermoplasmata archaeon]|nr:hypothetical protein [Thermoplasmata archaeon]
MALTDLVAQAIALTLQGVILATFVVVAITFVTFRRMNKDVRRARMFILAERLERFLAAFTVAFLFLTAALIANAAGHSLPAAASTIIVFVWLGGFLYGAIEIFFVVRPRPRGGYRLLKRPASIRTRVREAPTEGTGDAPK